MKKLLLTLIVSIVFCESILAQDDVWNPLGLASHWPDFDYHAYFDQKGFVSGIIIDGDTIKVEDSEFEYFESLEVAAFVNINGEEQCRGTKMFLYPGYVEELGVSYPTIDGCAIYYTTSGEGPVYFKLYDHMNGIEYTDCTIGYLGDPFAFFTEDWVDQGWDDPEHPVFLSFTTPEFNTQPIALASGWNWVSFGVEITLADLQDALVAAYPSAAMNALSIKSKGDGASNWNPGAHRWIGGLNTIGLDLSQMYMVKVPADGEITVEGMPVDPADHPATIKNGANWIAFPLSESMTVTEAFAGFPTNQDVIKAKTGGQAQWNSGANRWIGGLANTPLQPGQGYIYISKAAGDRTFTYPTSAK